MARPKADIDAEEVRKLAAMGCTNQEIADFFECHIDTLKNRFSDELRQGKANGRLSMKRQLFKKVQNGELHAMIWWGKNFADMADKIEQKVEQRSETTFKIGWADELDQLGPAEKDATPVEDPTITEKIQKSSVGTPIGEDDQRNMDDVEKTPGGSDQL